MNFSNLRPRHFSEQNQGLKKIYQEVQELRRIVALAETEAQEQRRLKVASTKKSGFIIEATSCTQALQRNRLESVR